MPQFQDYYPIKEKKHLHMLAEGEYADEQEAKQQAHRSAQDAWFKNTPLRDAEADYDATVKFTQDRAQRMNPQPQLDAPREQLAQPSVGAGANAQDHLDSDDDYFQRVFGNAGGIDEDELAPVGGRAKAPAEKKLGWGSRLWSGLKGLGQLALSPLIALGGSIGAGIQGRRLGSMQEEQQRLDENPLRQGASDQERKAYSENQSRLHTGIQNTQQSLGNFRQAWTQRNILNNVSRLFTGRNMKMNPKRTHYFTGGRFGDARKSSDDD